MGLLTRVPIDHPALLELINRPSLFCGMGVHAVSSAVPFESAHQTPDKLEQREQSCAGSACMSLREKIKFHAEQLWPVGGSPMPSSAQCRDSVIRRAFKDAMDAQPSPASIKRALEGTRFLKPRPHLRKR